MNELLIVVDYQRDFVDGALGFKEAENLLNPIIAECDKHLLKGNDVLFTLDYHPSNYLETREGKDIKIPHCIAGTEGTHLYGRLDSKIRDILHMIYSNDTVDYTTAGYDDVIMGINNQDTFNIRMLTKQTFGCIDMANPYKCEYALKKYSKVHICGLVTDFCVISNAVIAQALWNDARIIVHKDMCDSFSRQKHCEAIDMLKHLNIEVTMEAPYDGE